MPALSLPSTLLIFALQWLVFSGSGVAAQLWRRGLTGRGSTALEAILLAALTPCLLGYLAFAAYFLHPLAGRFVSWSAMGLILGTLAHAYLVRRNPAERPAVHARLLALTLFAGLFYLSALFVFTQPTFSSTARERFLAGMPGDNEIPRIFAERLYLGVSPKAPGGDWLSSDRPPLQSGLALVTLPALRALDFGFDKACATAGVWFQLLWIPALWVFLRWLGLAERQAHAATAALVFTGFLLFNSLFVWPKLAGAALVLLGFCTFFATEQAIDPRHRWIAGGALAAFGSLAHGGVMFSLLALVPLALLSFRARWRQWLLAGAAFALLSLPWIAYQRLYEPPGNRLIKWHIAGSIPPDSRGVAETLVTSYRDLGWSKALEVRRENFRILCLGEWRNLLNTDNREAIAGRRSEEIFHLFRTAAAWILGLAALPVLAWQFFRRRPAWRDHVRRHGLAVAWLALTLVLWLALMFFPFGTLVHQGSYVAPLLLLGLVTTWTLLTSRRLFIVLALVQFVLFALTWMPPSPTFNTVVPAPFAIGAAFIFALLVIALCVDALRVPPPHSAPAHCPLFDEVRAWFRAPYLNPWVLVIFAILLFLRKPFALVVPQLYAEDGTIFLVRNDLLGLRALIEPYMGYWHLIPRLVAFVASRLLDPAWWPTFYNLVAYLLWVFVVARTFSPRLPLPPALRPWLALALFLGPQTGEVLFCITNVQWVIAFLLIEQAFIAPPATAAQRTGDIVLLVFLGLTGPFVLALGPLLAWRWWRSRTTDNLAILLVATACAAVQAWWILHTGPKFDYPAFAASRFFEVIGQRLFIWPVFGSKLAYSLPPIVLSILGMLPVVALLGWSLRAHPRRFLRVQLVAAFLLMMAAGVYRARPDTWGLLGIDFGDRYFYLPRVLLWWLFILELDTAQRAIAWLARVLVLACALVHGKDYLIPAGPDYRWTEHVEPIRRGVRGDMMTLPEEWLLEYQGRPAR
jgi:hypothetical protein